jgi:RNA polymerase sigma factor (TIGR02999 family)
MSEVTQILSAIEHGDPHAGDLLLPLVYDELRRLAAAKLRQERPGQTLQATALVQEAYVRLVDRESVRPWENRRHFFAAAAEAMRRILVEQARRKGRLKRGSGRERIELDEIEILDQRRADDVVALDEALTKLNQERPAHAELVKLRYFAGFTVPEAAEALGISTTTADRYWTYARAWLVRELAASDDAEPGGRAVE